MSDEIKVLVERARRNAGWRNEKWQCITDPALLEELAARIEAMSAALTAQAEEIERLREDALALAIAAAALNIATDGMEDLRADRTAVLDALDAAASGFEQEIPQAVSAALKAAQEVGRG